MVYLLVQTVGTLIYNVTISEIAKRQFPVITKKNIAPLEPGERKSLLANVRALTIWKLSGLLVNQTDNIIITYFNGLITVGVTSNYTLLTGTLNTLLNQVFTGITASVGNHNAVETTEQKIHLFKAINLANFWLFGWGAIGICLVSSDLVSLMFGETYVLHWTIPLILAVNFYTVGMQNAVWTYNNTLGLFRQGRYLLLLTAAINLGASIILGTIWGLFGIYAATFISRLLTNIWYDPYKLFKHGFHVSVLSYLRIYFLDLIVLGISGCLCALACGMVHGTSLTSVLVKFLICSVIPNAIFFLVFSRTNEFAYLKSIATHVLKKLHFKNKFK